MQLLVIRHAIAMDRDEFAESGRPDDDRPLTDRGRKRMRAIARALADQVDRIDVLASSPYTRALQTAEIVARPFRERCPPPLAIPHLRPDGAFEELLAWIRDEQPETTAIVGHEPHLGAFVTWLLGARRSAAIEFKKGGAALLDLLPEGGQGAGILRWALTPAQLRRLDP